VYTKKNIETGKLEAFNFESNEDIYEPPIAMDRGKKAPEASTFF
jgi:hypothetical protein